MQNNFDEIEISMSSIVENIDASINSHEQMLQESTQKLQTGNLDEPSKRLVNSTIEFLKFHIGELKTISASITLAQKIEASHALSATGQIVH